MKVKFTKATVGERYSYAEGQEVEVVEEGHGYGCIPAAWASELLAAGTVVEVPAEAAAEGESHGEE
jgi:hypothetical protein